MRKTLAILGLAAVLAQPVSAMAQSSVSGQVRTDAAYRSSTRSGVQEVVLLPMRVVAGAVGAPVGAIGGMAKRTSQAVEWVNENTFRKVVDRDEEIMERPGKQFARGVVMVPVGVAGTAAALPLGVAAGAVEGTFRGFVKGFTWPEH